MRVLYIFIGALCPRLCDNIYTHTAVRAGGGGGWRGGGGVFRAYAVVSDVYLTFIYRSLVGRNDRELTGRPVANGAG